MSDYFILGFLLPTLSGICSTIVLWFLFGPDRQAEDCTEEVDHRAKENRPNSPRPKKGTPRVADDHRRASGPASRKPTRVAPTRRPTRVTKDQQATKTKPEGRGPEDLKRLICALCGMFGLAFLLSFFMIRSERIRAKADNRTADHQGARPVPTQKVKATTVRARNAGLETPEDKAPHVDLLKGFPQEVPLRDNPPGARGESVVPDKAPDVKRKQPSPLPNLPPEKPDRRHTPEPVRPKPDPVVKTKPMPARPVPKAQPVVPVEEQHRQQYHRAIQRLKCGQRADAEFALFRLSRSGIGTAWSKLANERLAELLVEDRAKRDRDLATQQRRWQERFRDSRTFGNYYSWLDR